MNRQAIFKGRKFLSCLPGVKDFPPAMLEAMACGCVPVVSNVGNIRDAARHAENAFLVNDYTDIKSFAKYIHSLLSDEKLRSGMAQQGILTV